MLAGMGLLPCDTVFLRRKIRRRTRAKVVAPMLAGGNLAGYEIHMGETTVHGAPFCRLDGGLQSHRAHQEEQLNQLACIVRQHIDLPAIYEAMEQNGRGER